MIPTILIFALIAIHWVADFVLQTHWQASNKSKNWWALSAHVATYTGALLLLTGVVIYGIPGLAVMSIPAFLMWVLLNGVIHFGVDAVTSRASSKLFAKDWHNFFVVVGFDQVIHYFTLFGTLLLFL